MNLRVRVSASTANLGSGFDVLGLALGIYDEFDLTVTGSGVRVEVSGEGAGDVPTDESHLVVRALHAACAALDYEPPGFVLRCRNAIPHARGLGSSAAAIVAGIAAGYGLAGQDLDERALQLAAGFEGHADNASASLYGGLTLAWAQSTAQGDRFRAVRLEPHPDLRPVVLVPDTPSATSVTRGLLPDRVPHADAVFAAGRCALAVQALTDRLDLLLEATEDRLHQDYREKAWPDTMRMVHELRANGVAATVSGAGPTVFAATTDGRLPPGVATSGFTVRELPVARTGVVTELTGTKSR